jgi:hypothetical protein
MPIPAIFLQSSCFTEEAISVIDQAYDGVVNALGLRDSAACAKAAKLVLDLADELVLFDAADLWAAALAKIRGAQ